MTRASELLEMARDSDFQRWDPMTRLSDHPKTRRWPTQRMLQRDGMGVWFDKRDADYLAALAPRNVIRMVEDYEAAVEALEWALAALTPYDHPPECGPMQCKCGFGDARAALVRLRETVPA